MTDEEADNRLEALKPLIVNIAEMAVENLAKIVTGQKRIAIVPRQHPKVIEKIYELRLVTPPGGELPESKAPFKVDADLIDELGRVDR